MHFSTKTIHAGQPSESQTGAVVAPIFQTTTYQQIGPGEHRGFDYTRTSNPTRKRLEAVLAELEGGDARRGVRVGAGRRARDPLGVPQARQANRRAGRRVWRHVPHAAPRLRADWLPDRRVDFSQLDDDRRRHRRGHAIVWLESPTNPRLLVYDIEAICKIAHAKGALVVVDNTFATPYFQRPFELGADLIVHSVTKYLAGHSDLIQGAVIGRDAAIFEPVGFLQNALGGVPSPFDCWLTLRGLKTMELRMERHEQNAAAVAEALTLHPRVARVYFPGLGRIRVTRSRGGR